MTEFPIKKTLISRYFESIRGMPDILDKGETFSLTDGSPIAYEVVPFSIAQMKAMTGRSDDSINSMFRGLKVVDRSGRRTYDFSSVPMETEISEAVPDYISREDLIKLTVYAITRSLGASNNGAAKVDEIVFQLKNDAGIPDDFMPASMMEMVEGRPLSDPPSLILNLQPSFSEGAIFPIFRISGELPVSVGFLTCYPKGFENDAKLVPEGLIKSVKDEFYLFTKEPGYQDFVAGRVLRSVVFNLERKKTRKLSKPLFDDIKIQALKKIGIVDEVNGSYSIVEALSLEKIKKLASELESKNHRIAQDWKAKMIKLQ
ncbi:MAG: hypothetical protein M1327_02670 [Candidatus Thermoplasmatota archaeon]|nr:hypothetical protein [Candidatus Thermoplasmatota archaeon]